MRIQRYCAYGRHGLLLLLALFSCICRSAEQANDAFASAQSQFENQFRAAIETYCLECHSTSEKQGELDLQRFHSVADIRGDVVPWQRVVEVLDDVEMPPKDAKHQPTKAELASLRSWVRAVLDADAKANAGDPGPVVLRRLNNAEYTYSIQDLTETKIEPAKQFPVDSAAGEGFTNVGNSLVISPALLQKYLDAGKEVAGHAMLLPNRIEFSSSTTSRDWTNEKLAAIRNFYSRFTDNSGATTVNLQGIQFETNGGGRLPLQQYLMATIVEREALSNGSKSIAEVARFHSLNEKYLATLWKSLNEKSPSLVLDLIRSQWRKASPAEIPAIVETISQWQQSLWRFTTIGHIGKRDGPTAWQVPIQPLAVRQELRVKVDAAEGAKDATLYLVVSDAGDGNEHDFAIWENARFVAPGQPDLLLRDARDAVATLLAQREKVLSSAAACLNAVAEIESSVNDHFDDQLAAKHGVDPQILAAWFDYLNIGQTETKVDSYLTLKMQQAESYDFIQGWTGADALSVIANSSEQLVRVPGDMKPHSVSVHPSPKQRVVVGWKSPIDDEEVSLTGRVQRAHIGCGNGVTWSLELRRGKSRRTLASGLADGASEHKFGPIDHVAIRRGDLVSLVIGPRNGDHTCDLTAIDLTINSVSEPSKQWDLAVDVSPDILASNPHSDRFGNSQVWHFFGEPDSGSADAKPIVPDGSLLAKWLAMTDATMKTELADKVQQLMQSRANDLPADSPDVALHRQLTKLSGPLFSAVRSRLPADKAKSVLTSTTPPFGLAPAMFGVHPDGSAMDAADLCVQAPSVVEVSLPSDFIEGGEFVVTTRLDANTGSEGSIQMQVLTEKPAGPVHLATGSSTTSGGKSSWSDGDLPVQYTTPILVNENSEARRKLIAQFDEFRTLFPAALCYSKIVPVDEVVTLTLFYREDEHLRHLMLSEIEEAELDQLWKELHFVSQDALALVDAYEQLWQFATQDADPSAFTPMREGIMQRAADFQKLQLETEPIHLAEVMKFADRAWRRPLVQDEKDQLGTLYRNLRQQDLSHDASIRLLLARVLVTPSFLYRTENAGVDETASPISNHELATRLSYFLWSSLPDAELRQKAGDGTLHETDVLLGQTKRMLADPRIRRMAIEFGCQWLHIRDFDLLDEKSDQHYPEFKELRGAMNEEAILFFEDLFRNDRSVLSLLDADHTFVNERLAKFYGISEPAERDLKSTSGDGGWRRVDGVRQFSRGGILTMAATLSKHSGASRTSPILRGNWVSEFLLGDKLPRPPKNVPVLPEETPNHLTERQLIERHSSDIACAKCHQRIDAFGFALEQFDTIGKSRTHDASGHEIDPAATLPDGTKVNGVSGLQNYLRFNRQDDFIRTFCRRLLGYALGRSIQLSDEPLIDDMMVRLKQHDYRFSAAVELIVASPQFLKIRGNGRTQTTTGVIP